jgi:hypothetical protein
MALLGFQARFVPLIERGDKTHTIRGPRADIHVGTRLDLYAAPRTKNMRLIFRAPCVAIEPIEILPDDPRREVYSARVRIKDCWLDPSEMDAFAKRDGFPDFQMMRRFWLVHRTLPFDGFVFHWDFAKRTAERRVNGKAV